ncbi:Cytochrome oxidase Cu insertion factor, SCO1/SenC/PrrC family [Nitrosomonas sp. Nm132]|nr:Cytochrome oxidase Cu insertion factor, SCO1/SenC/PrrC family [Nitrosomonas sp. Nm132]
MTLLMLSPVIASYLFHVLEIRPEGTVNYGELLEIKALQGQALNIENNTIFRVRQIRGKWSLITIDSGQCDEYCQKKLYQMRQVRLVQNTEKDRIERVWLIDDYHLPNQNLKNEYEGTVMLSAKDSDLLSEFPAVLSQRDHIYVVDPMGNLMMRFPRDANPTKISKDLKHLLKLSHFEH